MLAYLVSTYGYAALFVGTLLEGETVLVIAGVAAHAGLLKLSWVLIFGFLGSVAGDQIFFALGRSHGKRLMDRFPRIAGRAEKIVSVMHKHKIATLLGFRFIYGLRTLTPFAIGMSGIGYRSFLAYNLMGAASWTVIFGLAGFTFSNAMESLLSGIKHYEYRLLFVALAIVVLVWTSSEVKRRVFS